MKKVEDSTGIKEVEIKIKGRLIKYFVTFEPGVTTDDMKAKFNEILTYMSEKTLSYYDVTFYSIQEKEDKTIYPVTGYKHKNKTEISFLNVSAHKHLFFISSQSVLIPSKRKSNLHFRSVK